MFIFECLVVAIIGLYFGSFFTAISLRICSDEKVFTKRSACDSCLKTISFLSLTPIIGYILCKGRCKKCFCKVPIKYSIWEAIYSLILVINYCAFHNNLHIFLAFSILTTEMFVACVIDFETMYVYNVNILLFAISLFYFLFISKNLLITQASFVVACFPLIFKFGYEFIREKITKKKINVIGIGDICIFVILFFLLDFSKIAIIIALSGMFGILFGTIGKYVKSHYPFVPSIFLSCYIIFIWNTL